MRCPRERTEGDRHGGDTAIITRTDDGHSKARVKDSSDSPTPPVVSSVKWAGDPTPAACEMSRLDGGSESPNRLAPPKSDTSRQVSIAPQW